MVNIPSSKRVMTVVWQKSRKCSKATMLSKMATAQTTIPDTTMRMPNNSCQFTPEPPHRQQFQGEEEVMAIEMLDLEQLIGHDVCEAALNRAAAGSDRQNRRPLT